VYAVPFNPQDPMNTPRGLNTGDPAIRAAILQSFGNAINVFQTAGVAMNSTLGSLQFVTLNGQRMHRPGVVFHLVAKVGARWKRDSGAKS